MLINKSELLRLTVLPFILLPIAAGTSSVLAQPYNKEPLTWGVKAGINVSGFYGDAAGHSDAREHFSGGLLFNYRFNEYWALQPEVIFNIKGAELSPGLTGENGKARYTFGYLNIPILAKYYIPPNPILTPNLYAGPEVGFKLYGETDSRNIDDELKDAELGLAFGAGLDLNIGDSANLVRTVGLDLRYSVGVTNVFDTPQEHEVRNSVFLAALFLGF